MTKYIVFGWIQGRDTSLPADELLGTTSDLMDDWNQEYSYNAETGWTEFGQATEFADVELAPNLMRGKTFPMTVYLNWGKNGRENASRFLAFYEIPE